MSMRMFIVLLMTIAPLPAQGGAWMRERGSAFLSFGFTGLQETNSGDVISRQELFLEYGLRSRLTLGAKGKFDSDQTASAEIFARFPIINDDSASKVSAEIGIGGDFDGIITTTYVRTAISWGRGIEVAGKYGWVNIDAGVEWPVQGRIDGELAKIDATFGVSLSDRYQIMMQAFFESDDAGERVTLVPSVIYRRPSGVRYIAGVAHQTGRGGYTGVKLGIWREF